MNVFLIDLTGQSELVEKIHSSIPKSVNCIQPCSGFDNCKRGSFIPLFLCYSYDEIRAHGFNVPREFVFEVGLNPNPNYADDSESLQPKMLCEIVGDSLLNRIEILKSLFDSSKTVEVKVADVRDWCAGAFRRYLFMDDDVHGISGTFSVRELIKNDNVDPEYCKKWFWGSEAENKENREMLRARFLPDIPPQDNDPLKNYKTVLNILYEKKFKTVVKILNSQNYKDEKRNNIIKKFFKEQLPEQKGWALKFISPLEKIRILVVDDKAGEAKVDLETKEDGINLSQIFAFESLELKQSEKDSPAEFIKYAIEEFRKKVRGAYYDVILLDLCLGEKPGSDLTGYHLIKKFKQWLPSAHIIIYSEHEDMGHIARAFREGANWFLKKSDAKKKLARHFISLMARRNWKREYKVVQSKYKIDVQGKDEKFRKKFYSNAIWRYLTIKSIEMLPGHYIKVNKMGGGISTAVTFRAQKGVTRDSDDNQAPVIIKIDSIFNTRMEYERYFRFVRPYIANESGRVENREIIINRDNAAIVYTFAGRRDAAHELNTLDELLRRDLLSRETCDYEKYRKMFDALFDEITSRLHRVTPEQEFRDKDETPVQLSEYSDYPNQTFGELDSNCNKHWFFSNFTYRMPIEYEIKDFTIDKGNKNNKGNKNKIHNFEVYGVYKDDEKPEILAEFPYTHVIECQHYSEEKKWYEKILLKGGLASYYVRFRKHLLPGMILPVSVQLKKEKELMTWSLCSCSEKKLYQIRAKKTGDNSNQERCFRISEKLYTKVNGWCRRTNGEHLIAVRDALKKLVDEESHRFVCPVGIVHGDLNLKNIMIESRVNPPKEIQADITKVLSDVWLIDFARTRRDIVAHDFNVAFTSVLPLLFQPDLVGVHKKDKPFEQNDEQKKYVEELDEKLEPYLRHILFDKYDTLSDLFAEDQRLVFMYKILRRIRKAALATGMSEDMYLLTTALTCLYSFKLYLKQGMPEAATALVMAGLLCVEKLNPSDNYFEASKTTAL